MDAEDESQPSRSYAEESHAFGEMPCHVGRGDGALPPIGGSKSIEQCGSGTGQRGSKVEGERIVIESVMRTLGQTRNIESITARA